MVPGACLLLPQAFGDADRSCALRRPVQVPSTVARLNQVASLVGVLASRRGAADMVRIYALLVLARLCNYSPECQMDAVRVSLGSRSSPVRPPMCIPRVAPCARHGTRLEQSANSDLPDCPKSPVVHMHV